MGAAAFRLLLTAIAGLMHAVSMGPPWGGAPLGWLQLLSLSVLIHRMQSLPTPLSGALHAWTFCLLWFCGTFWWLFVSMNTYGGLAAPLAALAVLALAAALALYHALAGWAFVRWRDNPPPLSALLFASLWMMAELARGTWLTGFGWGASAYAHVEGLARVSAYVGAYGTGALLALIAYGLASWARLPTRPRGLASLAAAAAIAVAMTFVPAPESTPTSSIDVALLQGNIAQDEKFVPGGGIEDALAWYGDQIRSSRASLTIAPETAIPLLPGQLPPTYWEEMATGYSDGRRAALVGLPLGSMVHGYTNSVVALAGPPSAARNHAPTADPEPVGIAYRYDKHHLVPFGEFIPPLFRWFTDMMSIPLGDFRRGPVGQSSFEWRGERFAPTICYEDLFGEELAARFADPVSAPTVLVNLSNIGWFGRTVALEQHLQISRMRSLEFSRPMVRATNTGPTVIIDHTARVTHSLPPHVRGVLIGTVQGRSGVTPFAWWSSRFGLWPLWMLAILLTLAAARAAHRRSPPAGT